MAKKDEAVEYNERGNACREAGNWQAAIELYEQAAALAPTWSSPAYNLGLVYKYQNRWKESLKYNQRAVKLNPKDEAAWWNLGIAATALGDWTTARAAWKGFGIDVPAGRGPLDFPCGIGPIRLNPDGPHAEVVWAERLCPARARVLSIPLAESGHRWKDVVLNDGAPVGHRMYRGQEVPVFNELDRLEESVFGTYLAEVALPNEAANVERLMELSVEQDGIGVEDWTTSIHLLCKACSEGRPHDGHDHNLAPPEGVRRIAFAATSVKDVRRLLKAWQAETKLVELRSLETLVKPQS